MARRSPIATLLAARTAALAAAVPAALGGEAAAVHQARVASRRLREVVPILEPVAPTATRACAAVRRVTRALGPLRELDVTATLLAELVATAPLPPLAQVTVTRQLSRARGAALTALRRALPEAGQARLMRALEALALDVEGLPGTAVAASLDARVLQRAARLDAALDHLGVLYDAERLHAVRIAVKQLRYALEVAGVLRRGRTAAALRRLRAVQETLGRAHDLHVLGSHVRRIEGQLVSRSRGAARELRQLARRIDRLCRELHAAFLGRRAALQAVTAGVAMAARPVRRRTAA